MRVIARAHCPGLSSFETATCLANFFAGRFPHGNPKREFFDSNYDPAKVLSNHLAGEPGHCVTRTGLLAATLLAMGIPARVVQIQPLDGSSGHNVLEIWDSKMGGWVLMDPTYSGSLDMANRHAAPISLPMESITPRWQQEPALHKVLNVTLTDAQKFYTEQRLRTSNIVYPEPWLYTRVGKSIAPRPFQGQFVMVGSTSLRLGLGQRLLQSGILLTLVGLALTAGMLAFRMVRRFQPRVLTPRGQTFHPHLESENAAVLDTVTLP